MPLFKMEKSDTSKRLLADKYIVPPFSILNTISAAWQRRKDAWESLGIESTEGRDVKRNNAMPVNTFSARGEQAKTPERTSTFDPVLCEIMYRWFCPSGGVILDPFAGGSVRGLVAGLMGYKYHGFDISRKQVEANQAQLEQVDKKLAKDVIWTVADSATMVDDCFNHVSLEENSADMIFTCPPYYNLEKYTDDPKDLSNMVTYSEFRDRYISCLCNAVTALKKDRFFVIVVSEIRNPKTGEYYCFVPDTINILTAIGCRYYNEIILENNIGSLPIRAPKYFDQSRKIGRHHQNILVFYNGDTTKISEHFGGYSGE